MTLSMSRSTPPNDILAGPRGLNSISGLQQSGPSREGAAARRRTDHALTICKGCWYITAPPRAVRSVEVCGVAKLVVFIRVRHLAWVQQCGVEAAEEAARKTAINHGLKLRSLAHAPCDRPYLTLNYHSPTMYRATPTDP